ncbi:hypothetical protein [Parasphingopyxis marina]|uniref:Uncharacterized protein n=1 Tax=Parasphingopyxis marina TaxID=2761622 RepID=A0A842I4I3_9SPHN|nr:hypothetical protein [Parasphingopyxis marina]MBC2779184.1 hypothetical protein [Parasphingopyxis marina]
MAIGSTARIAALLATAAGLSGCTIYDGYGTGYNSGYYADSAYPDECYDKDGYLYPECEDATYVARNGYGYGRSWYNNYGPYGWYDGFYYPGYSVYIFDRQGHRHRWSDNHRRHWEGRRHARRDGNRDGRHWDGRRDRDGRHGDDTTAGRDRDRDGRRGDRRRDGERRAVAPDTNPRGVRGQMRGARGASNGRGRSTGNNANAGRQASPPAPTVAPPPPPAPARTNRNRQNSPTTRQTQRVRQNPSRNDPQ